MRIDSLKLPQAALSHSKVHGSGKTFPGTPATPANEAAASQGPTAETPVDTANSATPAAKTGGEKLTPAGLLAAQLRFQSMDSAEMNKGQSHAQEVINRNIARYQEVHGTTAPAGDSGSTAGAVANTAEGTAAVAEGSADNTIA